MAGYYAEKSNIISGFVFSFSHLCIMSEDLKKQMKDMVASLERNSRRISSIEGKLEKMAAGEKVTGAGASKSGAGNVDQYLPRQGDPVGVPTAVSWDMGGGAKRRRRRRRKTRGRKRRRRRRTRKRR